MKRLRTCDGRKEKMKKLFTMIIMIMVIVSVSACGQSGSSEETGNVETLRKAIARAR